MSMISVIFITTLFFGILIIFLARKYNAYIQNNEKYMGKILLKNIFVCIGLIIITGAIYTVYEIFLTERYSDGISYDTLVGVIVIFILLFFNLLGYIQLIINVNKNYAIIIFHGIFIVSTFLVFKLIDYCINLLIENNIISECSSILFIIIIMIVENIISFILIKIYIRVKYKKRSNDT